MLSVDLLNAGLLCSDSRLLLGGERVVCLINNSAHARKEHDCREHRDSHHVLGDVPSGSVGKEHAGEGDEQGSAKEGKHGSDAELESLAILGDDRVDAREGTSDECTKDEGGEGVGDDRGGNSRNHVRLQSDSLGECRGGGGEGSKDEGDECNGHDGRLLGLVGLLASENAGDGSDEEDGGSVSGADESEGISDVHGDDLDKGEGKEEDEDKGTNRHDGLQGWDLARLQVSPHASPYG